MKHLFVLAALAVSFTTGAEAPKASQASAYAGQEARDIKAMSPEEVQSYLSGKGMGLAKAAELNGYPGPSHVLALASQLNLTPEQKKLTEALFHSMEEKAVRLGAPLVEEERTLDRSFASKAITPEALASSLARIGELQAKVREAHLEAHLAQVRILTEEQVALYMQMRGYASNGSKADHEHHHHTGS
ncbi:MAG: Spy/CpxP family protein refolding chaperone [Rhizobacter sp.]